MFCSFFLDVQHTHLVQKYQKYQKVSKVKIIYYVHLWSDWDPLARTYWVLNPLFTCFDVISTVMCNQKVMVKPFAHKSGSAAHVPSRYRHYKIFFILRITHLPIFSVRLDNPVLSLNILINGFAVYVIDIQKRLNGISTESLASREPSFKKIYNNIFSSLFILFHAFFSCLL